MSLCCKQQKQTQRKKACSHNIYIMQQVSQQSHRTWTPCLVGCYLPEAGDVQPLSGNDFFECLAFFLSLEPPRPRVRSFPELGQVPAQRDPTGKVIFTKTRPLLSVAMRLLWRSPEKCTCQT